MLTSCSSKGLVLSLSLSLALCMIAFCSSIAGCILSYAVSIRSCSLSICACIAALPLPTLASASTMRSSARCITKSSLPSSSSILAICAMPSSAAAVCSMCAFDRKPKIPILVINIRTRTAMLRYVLSHHTALRQYQCSQTAVTSLPTSSTLPIIIMGIAAAANIATNPLTL